MLLLGLDIGSSSVKGALIDASTGQLLKQASYPPHEFSIHASQPGWAEQDPAIWWEAVISVVRNLSQAYSPELIKGIGIAYQMHGLVLIDKNKRVLRPAIIWCDSRAVELGDTAFKALGNSYCLEHYLNSPGNFTASKLKWVKENEPEVFRQIHKIMLPGDYIAMRLSGQIQTTISGLSEGILWDFKQQTIASELASYFGFDTTLVPPVVDTFSPQATLSDTVATTLGLKAGIPIGYRAGDQPNNAFSLGVLSEGEVATTAGTSGVVYGLSKQRKFDSKTRINTFAHVNYQSTDPMYGVLLCINGTGILYRWLRENVATGETYETLNQLASQAPIGAEGLRVLPFGNGAERILGNQNLGAQWHRLDFNRHTKAHLIRASLEGIAFSLKYGMEIMGTVGVVTNEVRAGYANLFLSPLFQEIFTNVSKTVLHLFNTDGAQGAARGAGIGIGLFGNYSEAFLGLNKRNSIEPNEKQKLYLDAYQDWKHLLERQLNLFNV